MSLKINYDENINSKDIVPLESSEINSILKAQSDSVFVEETKMKQNKSDFVKKSLIDIALEFKNKETESDKAKQVGEENSLSNEVESQEKSIPQEIVSQENSLSEVNEDNKIDSTEILSSKDISDQKDLSLEKENVENNNQINASETFEQNQEDIKPQIEEDTQQALNSVRDAVSQSINKPSEEKLNVEPISDNEKEIDNASQKIEEDLESFKNIFSDLSNITQDILYETIENKIVEIAQELAGYQIDKMPEKYEKKIKTFLKNINRFEEKMSIETNDKDYEALSKIDEFNNINNEIKFSPNSQLSRGDIVLNCDGMHYSEKTKNNIKIINKNEK